MRRRLLFLAVLSLAGCNRFAGPLENRNAGRVEVNPIDGSRRSIAEQQVIGRERFGISEDDFRIGPKGYIDRPSPTGR